GAVSVAVGGRRPRAGDGPASRCGAPAHSTGQSVDGRCERLRVSGPPLWRGHRGRERPRVGPVRSASVERHCGGLSMKLRRLAGAWLLVLLSAPYGRAAGDASRLLDAVKAGDQEGVRAQLKQAAGVNVRAADGTVPLHWAARGDYVAIVDLLVRAGAQVNVADRYGITPLMLAAANGHAETIARLAKAGADVNAGLPEGQTVLMTAARTGKPEALKILLAHGADANARAGWIGETALMWAAAENHRDAVKILLDGGADPNVQSYPTNFKRKVSGQTVLT